MNETQFDAGRAFLAEQGLNLLAVFDTATLPKNVGQPLADHGVSVTDFSRLVLIGHGGRQMWQALHRFGAQTADPVDHFSWEQTAVFIDTYLNGPRHLQLYPFTDYPIPLGSLGELAGWSRPSPIGSGINPTYGLWFAYRAAFLVDLPLPLIQETYSERPCDSCVTKPCVSSCPASAVHASTPLNFNACVTHRLAPQSSCSQQCLARLACPVSPESRYTMDQINYHYSLSLPSLTAYTDATDGN